MTLLQVVTGKYQVCEKLRNGQSIIIRAIHSDDKAILIDEMKHLSRESKYFRFFTPKTSLTEAELVYFSELDLIHHVGLLASLVDDAGKESAAGFGRYIVINEESRPISAELAFEVREECQGLGIGTLLLQQLMAIGRSAGIEEFVAYVLCENRKMLDVFEHMQGPFFKELIPGGVLTIRIPLTH
ncbi:MAG: GNAT family N-acetyltransferase [Candidatus Melainabacteria bacterium]|nr:GNAT family N-acetyltransferase [Candidatus Melainabacteria bacterium]